MFCTSTTVPRLEASASTRAGCRISPALYASRTSGIALLPAVDPLIRLRTTLRRRSDLSIPSSLPTDGTAPRAHHYGYAGMVWTFSYIPSHDRSEFPRLMKHAKAAVLRHSKAHPGISNGYGRLAGWQLVRSFLKCIWSNRATRIRCHGAVSSRYPRREACCDWAHSVQPWELCSIRVFAWVQKEAG